mmetsp:Transcript_51182/g.153041  ORF Transcript_51182/g.153041 Transcript_51182/m.153041 type:complete len:350 (-) Transcript_51182:23-1072(-)
MVIVYSPTYLTKLWTVYELASMLVLHPEGKLIVLPTVLPRILCLGVLVVSGLENLFWLLYSPVFGGAFQQFVLKLLVFLLILLTVCLLLVLGRRMAAEHQDILRRVADFRIQSATCLVEADRELVEGNVVAFMKCMGVVGKEKDGDEAEIALEAFNELVHERVPRALSRSLGRLGLGYRTVSAMPCVFLFRPFDFLGAYLHGDQHWHFLVARFAESYAVALGIYPLCLFGVLYVASDRPAHPLGCSAFTAILLLKGMLWMAISFVVWGALDRSIRSATSDGVWILPSAGIIAVVAAATVFVYRPHGAQVCGQSVQWAGLHATAAPCVVGSGLIDEVIGTDAGSVARLDL